MKKFNIIISTFRYKEEEAENEFKQILDSYKIEHSSEISEISGIIKFLVNDDPMRIISIIRKILQESPWEIRFTLRVIPILYVVDTDLAEITKVMEEMKKKISLDDTYRITVEKRHSPLKTQQIINDCANIINRKVSLENPNKIILIEILGKYCGISLVNNGDIFSSIKEKRELDN